MKWLQWSSYDLQNGLGGVEVSARSLARELCSLGVAAELSDQPQDATGDWDVLHSHGSSPLPRVQRGAAVRVHTLHGTTFGRMIACREFFWIGGYLAYAREVWSLMRADVVLGVRGDLHLLKLARFLGKVTRVCGNGWDSGAIVPSARRSEAFRQVENRAAGKWLFIGRGDDPVKGAKDLRNAIGLLSAHGMRLLAIPGDGFENVPEVDRAGRLTSDEVRTLLSAPEVKGLVLTSHYEGNPLVVLEALAEGLPVVSTRVGNWRALAEMADGLTVLPSTDPERLVAAMLKAENEELHVRIAARLARKEKNQRALPRWSEVARSALAAVEESRTR